MLCKETSVQVTRQSKSCRHPSTHLRSPAAASPRGTAIDRRAAELVPTERDIQGVVSPSPPPDSADDAADVANLGLRNQSRPGHATTALRQTRGRQACRLPVLRPPVVQPAGPTGETEDGVEGALQAVQRPLCRQQGQRQSTPPPRHAPQPHCSQNSSRFGPEDTDN